MEHAQVLNMVVRRDRELFKLVEKLYRIAAFSFSGAPVQADPNVGRKNVVSDGKTTVACTDLQSGLFLQLSGTTGAQDPLLSVGYYRVCETVDDVRLNRQFKTWEQSPNWAVS
jgi:hypothetical protein